MFQYSNIIISYWILLNFRSKEGGEAQLREQHHSCYSWWMKVESLPLPGGHMCPDVPPTVSPKEPGCSCLVRNQQEAKATERDFRVKLALEVWVDSWQGRKPAWVRLASLARGWMVQQCPGNFRIIDSSMGTSPSSKISCIYIHIQEINEIPVTFPFGLLLASYSPGRCMFADINFMHTNKVWCRAQISPVTPSRSTALRTARYNHAF